MRTQKQTGQQHPSKIKQLYEKVSLQERVHLKYQEFIHKNHIDPNYLILNIINKEYLSDYWNQYFTTRIEGRITSFYGMQIIWTEDISEDKIICLRD